jgi:iron complex outermembrane recepter protein
LQGYYDGTRRDAPPSFSEALDILDLQLQHSARPIGIHTLVWGGEFRYSIDRVTNASLLVPSVLGLAVGPPRPFFGFLPTDVKQRWPSLFAQDEMMLRKDLRLTAGARLERNDFLLIGGPDVRSETAHVYELGYRGQPTGSFSYSATLYHTDYDHLRSQELVLVPPAHVVFSNGLRGNSTGIETWGTYLASETWRLGAGLNGLRERLTLAPGSNDRGDLVNQQGSDPTHTWMMRSSLDLPYRTELDAIVKRVSALSHLLQPAYSVPAYTTIDLRAGWKALRDLELSLTGRNLFSGGHGELTDPATRTRFGQDVFFKAECRF